MSSRAELEIRANAVNVTLASYPNDSKLEQAVIYAEKQLGSSSSAVTVATTTAQAARMSGGANV